MRGTFSSALRMMLMLNVPATVGLVALSTPIVALLFEHGSFTAAATAATAAALVCYAPGLIGYSAIKLAVPAFYSLQDSRTPVLAGAVSVAFNLTVNLDASAQKYNSNDYDLESSSFVAAWVGFDWY